MISLYPLRYGDSFYLQEDFYMRRRPMTTDELFNRIVMILKEKNRLPDILDYGLATGNALPITNCEFDLRSNLAYGNNEGIYLVSGK